MGLTALPRSANADAAGGKAMPDKGVLLDMDGLLIDSERIYLGQFRRALADFDLPDISHVFYDCIGLRGVDGRAVLRAGLAGVVDYDQFVPHWEKLNMEAISGGIPLRPGVKAVLTAFHAQGIPMAVATSTGATKAEHRLTQAGLRPFLSTVVGGDQVENGKPDPEIYLRAADALGLKAQECTAFEDSDTGVRAALASGARTVQVPDLKDPSPETRALGHHISQSLAAGAIAVGLLPNGFVSAA